jgi:hypothetical protein
MQEQNRFKNSIFFSYFSVQLQCLQRAPGLQKRATISTQILDLAGTGDRTLATCVAGSGASGSAIHYDIPHHVQIGIKPFSHQ